MDLRIGVLSHTITQHKLRQKKNQDRDEEDVNVNNLEELEDVN